MRGVSGGRIELAVPNAAARRHALAVARQNHRSRSQAVFVLKLAFKNVGDDFHIAMRMRRKAIVGSDPIFVDNTQRTESHPLRVPVIVEAESVVSLQPSVIAPPPSFASSNLNHGYLPV